MVSGAARGRGEIALDRRLDAVLAFGGELLFVGLAPRLPVDEISPQAGDRLFLPVRLDFFRRTIAGSVIRGRVVAEPISERLDQAGALAVAGGGNRLLGRGAHRDHVIAVDLLAGEARGDSLLRQRLARGLQSAAARISPIGCC